MENASKALIIAGAILLSILIISLGIMIFNQASSVVNNNSMSEVDIQQFNTKFTSYEGTNVRGAQVNSLLQTVVSSNMQQDDVSRQVSVTIDSSIKNNGTSVGDQAEDAKTAKKVPTGATYIVETVVSESGSDKGLVNEIHIKPST